MYVKDYYFGRAVEFVSRLGRGSLITISDLRKNLGFGYIWCVRFLRFLEVCGYLRRVQGKPVVYLMYKDIDEDDYKRLMKLWIEKNIYRSGGIGDVFREVLKWLEKKPKGFTFTVHNLVEEFGGHRVRYARILGELRKRGYIEETGMKDMGARIYIKK